MRKIEERIARRGSGEHLTAEHLSRLELRISGLENAIERPDTSTAHTYYGSAVSSNGGIATPLCSAATYGYAFPALTIDPAGKKRRVVLIPADQIH